MNHVHMSSGVGEEVAAPFADTAAQFGFDPAAVVARTARRVPK